MKAPILLIILAVVSQFVFFGCILLTTVAGLAQDNIVNLSEQRGHELIAAGRFREAATAFNDALRTTSAIKDQFHIRQWLFQAQRGSNLQPSIGELVTLIQQSRQLQRATEATAYTSELGRQLALRSSLNEIEIQRLRRNPADALLTDRIDSLRKELQDAGATPDLRLLLDVNHAHSLKRLSQFASAEQLLQPSEKMVRSESIDDAIAQVYWGIRGSLAVGVENFCEAYKYYQNCHHAIKRLEFKHRDTASRQELENDTLAVLNHFIWLAIQLGDYRLADQHIEEALTKRGGHAEAAGADVFALYRARLFTRKNLFGDAVETIQAALQQNPLPDIECYLRSDLALNYLYLGKVEDSRTAVNQATPLFEKQFTWPDKSLGELQVNRAWIAWLAGDQERAIQQMGDAVKQFTALEDSATRRLIESKAYLALMLVRSKNVEQFHVARSLIRDAVRGAIGYVHDKLHSPLARRDKIALVAEFNRHFESPLYPSVIDIFLQIAPRLRIGDNNQLRILLEWRRALQLPDSTSIASTDDPEINSLVEQLTPKIASRERKDLTFDERQSLFDLDLRASELERRRATDQSLVSDRPLKAWSFEQYQQSLDAATAFIELRRVETVPENATRAPFDFRELQRYVLFVASHNEVKRFELGSAAKLDQHLERLMAACQTEQRIDASDDKALRDAIVRPVTQFAPDAKTVIASGEGALVRMPLAGLQSVSHSGNYWIEDVRFLRLLQVPVSTLNITQKPDRPKSWLAVGDVDYGNGPLKFGKLSNTGDEVAFATNVLSQGQESKPQSQSILSGMDASRTAVVAGMPGRDLLYFATHGYFRATEESTSLSNFGYSDDLDSGLCLSIANQGHRDGFLTAADVRALDLNSTQLAVLSACRTSLGHLQQGGGSLGLVDAFHSAGTDHVVSAFWDVDDNATRELMQTLFAELVRPGTSPSLALAIAQRQMIRSGKHRSYWAAWADWAAP